MLSRVDVLRALLLLTAAGFMAGCSADAEIEVSPSELDFGTDASTLRFTVRNAADDSGIFTSGKDNLVYNIYQNRGWIVSSPISGTSEGEADTITVNIQRSALSPGVNTGMIRVESNGGTARVGVTATNPVPVCSVTPNRLDFGMVVVGASWEKTFTITNTGSGTLSGEVREGCLYFHLLGSTTYNLGPQESHTFTVRFEPFVSGPRTCLINTGSDLCSNVTCSGTAP